MERRYKNGNIDVKIDSDALNTLMKNRAGFKDVFDQFANQMSNVDCHLLGNPWCMSNYCVAYTFYCANNGLAYNITDSMIYEFAENKVIKCQGYKPSAEQLAAINNM